ncbi:GTP-binding protein gtr2 [Neolecta irregularis DAH-3]|uniref:GTP-binding protein gtr2 n=1 Tax=Neolecta irregularis (strain DAH-3) TaxID=1198029 RepID=A0A1U7LIP1_NEOID|nr:GTP-binding protein gtr2 [Neolecta irregularis DAH-3]|eukprot:OLL22514.1 GTP-binding protein gtr2 [Neolecta irregularis DAH-3]
MAHVGAKAPRLLLMGLRRSGKSSIQKVVFQKMPPQDTLYLGTSAAEPRESIGSFVDVQVLDFPSQLDFFDSEWDFEGVLRDIGALIFVIDAQDEYLEALSALHVTIMKVLRMNPGMLIEIFVHKVDGLSDDYRIDTQRDIQQRTLDELADAGIDGVTISFHLTSIFDHSIFEAFSKVIQKLIPQLPTLENLLNILCSNSGIEKAFLFDVVSKIYIATDSSPVDVQSYEICADFIDVIYDISSIYSFERTKQTNGDNETGEEEISSIMKLNNGLVIYLRAIDKYLVLICLMRHESMEKHGLSVQALEAMTKDEELPVFVDTVIVGSGPAALFLSWLLHGNTPSYVASSVAGHPDPVLHGKLANFPNDSLYHVLRHCPDLFSHIFSNPIYSTKALPINAMFDALLRPNIDVDPSTHSLIEFQNTPSNKVTHLVIGDSQFSGGQWVDNVSKKDYVADSQALSYGELLSLPGFSFSEWHKAKHGAESILERPYFRDVAEYYSSYPEKTGIADTLRLSTRVTLVQRTREGFEVRTQSRAEDAIIHCRHVVLASGLYSSTIPASPALQPYLHARYTSDPGLPIMVVGSGFSAADAIKENISHRPVIHLYHWHPEASSPLKYCHPQAYPDYAQVYRQMKLSAASGQPSGNYEGLPNSLIKYVKHLDNGELELCVSTSHGDITRRIGQIGIYIGRRGKLDYLSEDLMGEIGLNNEWLQNDGLRRYVKGDLVGFHVAEKVWAIGSVMGDSLVRQSMGGVIACAADILHDIS